MTIVKENYTNDELLELGRQQAELLLQAQEASPDGQVSSTTIIKNKQRMTMRSIFVTVFIENLYNIVENEKLNKSELRVFIAILRAMSFGNLVNISQAAIGRQLNILPGNINRVFKSLTDKGILVKHGGHTYVNPNVVAKGLTHRLDSVKREAMLAAAIESDNITSSFNVKAKIQDEEQPADDTI